jgi:hypothetical protein
VADESIVEEYIRLATGIDQHLPGYVDAYYGPAEWREDVVVPLPELAARAERLAHAVTEADSRDEQRRDYLSRHVFAMQTTLRLLQGENLSLAEEVAALYNVHPERVPESVFEEAHQILDELLPPGENLRERMIQRRKNLEIPVERVEELLPVVHKELRTHTRELYPLPENESVEFLFVQNQPWSAYNWYLGECRSKIEINTDLPLRINHLADFIAHEGYPGHHTEGCIKEARLVRKAGHIEHSIALINSPACVIAEGIATSALGMVMPDENWIAWHQDEIFPKAGFKHLSAQRERQIDLALMNLSGLAGNAAFLLHDDGMPEEKVSDYLQHYGLLREQEALKNIEFISHPLYRSYIFTYSVGKKLLQELFAKNKDAGHYFTRLLTEPVTPSQIRGWMKE